MFARFATTPISPELVAGDTGLTLTTLVGAADLARTARSTVAQSSGTHGAEFVFWGDADLLAAIGVITADASLLAMVGSDAQGIGWRIEEGNIYSNGAAIATGLDVPIKGDIVGVRALIDTGTLEFYLNADMVYSADLPAAAGWYFAVSLGSADAGELSCVVNSGQWMPMSAAAAAGWAAAPAVSATLRVADIDYLCPHDASAYLAIETGALLLTEDGRPILLDGVDDPAARYEGVIAADGMTTYAELGFWPWGGAGPTQGGNAQVQLLDADGLMDALSESGIDGLAVEVQLGDPDSGAGTAVARFTGDYIEVIDDQAKLLHLRDANADLDVPINLGVFLPSVPALAWRPLPVVIGAVASVPSMAANSDGSVGFLSDTTIADMLLVMDRGDPMEDGDWSLDPTSQQLCLTTAPVGPVTADISTIGVGMQPANLGQTLVEIFGRAKIGAWEALDADTIDASTGYGGIGYYAVDMQSVRAALAAILPTYGAGWYQDEVGLIRVARVIDPETVNDADLAFDLAAADLTVALVCTPDDAPNLSRRMGYRPNAHVHGAGDLVTDLVDVPPSRRLELTSACRGQAYAATPMAARYRNADSAPAIVSYFWRQEDAQAEIERVCTLYATPRFFYQWRVRDISLAPHPGDVGRITHPRYGLEAGRKVLVRSIERNPTTGDVVLTLWG